MSNIAILGAGYVGVCTGIVLAQRNHRVLLVDVDQAKVRALNRGQVPFHEPGAPEALRKALKQGSLRATEDAARAVAESGFTFLCVGTPQGKGGKADLAQLRAAVRSVGTALVRSRAGHVLVVKSTVPPGTADEVVLPALSRALGRSPRASIEVASNPEFLREGAALHDAVHPDRIVIGARSESTAAKVAALYDGFDCPVLRVDLRTAEMIKYASNAFLAAKVGLSNELANVCERVGVDWYRVAEGVGLDARIGPQFMRAGVGFGGSCFPKDVSALVDFARRKRAPAKILKEVLRLNDRQPSEAVRLLLEELGTLRGKRIALLGLAFKTDTDDVRETRALPIYRALRARGARVVCHDPTAFEPFRRLAPDAVAARTVEEALRGADGCIVQAEWAAYRAIAPADFVRWMRKPVVVDGRRTFRPEAMRAGGVRYRGIGLGWPAEA